VMGNYHARFLGGDGAVMRCLYPVSTQHRLREHNNALPQSMTGFQFPDHGQYLRRIRHSRTQAGMRSTVIVMFDPQFQN
jgi:hypothetical protein